MIVIISLVMALTGFVSASGLFNPSRGSSITYQNPYGDSVVLAGSGLYAWDSASLFAFIWLTSQLASCALADSITRGTRIRLPYRGFFTFLILSGLALIGAWLPDILAAHAAGRSLALIENYTTEITYVLDMGIIGPAALLTAWERGI